MRSNWRKTWFYIAVVILGVPIGLWTGLVFFPWLQIQNSTATDKEKFDASLKLAETLVSGIGTVATITGGVFLYLNFTTAREQAKAANEQARIANRNAELAAKNAKLAETQFKQDMEQSAKEAKLAEERFRSDKEKSNREAQLAEDRLITERFSKAVEQLGSASIHVRLGGIYALERIAQDSDRDYWQIMEVLTAFVRETVPCRPDEQQKNEESSTPIIPLAYPDVQAVLTILCRRKKSYGSGEDHPLDLRLTNLHGAFLEGVNFRKANLSGANLSGTHLSNSILDNADLMKADLSGAFINDASLKRAKFHQAKLVQTKLMRSQLHEANFYGANLHGCMLNKAELTRASFREVKHLTPQQIKNACSWEKAAYDEGLQKQLGLWV